MFSVRWSIVRLIWLRELRDQLRDRRTMTMILLLPLLIYPLAGLGLVQLASGVMSNVHTIGIIGAKNLPPPSLGSPGKEAITPASLMALAPHSPMTGLAGTERVISALALTKAQKAQPRFPTLLTQEKSQPRFVPRYLIFPEEAATLRIKLLPNSAAKDQEPLKNMEVDVLLIIPPDFHRMLLQGKQPNLFVLSRPGDEVSTQARQRLLLILSNWQRKVKETRFAQHALPADFDMPFRIVDPELLNPSTTQATAELYELMILIFPVILVMWSLAGALYPAVDLCAGEKERGTMETLLISPAQREEIVLGKFFTIWVFSAATALLNLLSMSLTAWQFSGALGQSPIQGMGAVWCVILILPLSAFFSAICLSIGAYARSTKEGQYYLMPLFLVTMPLVLVIMVPGVTLSPLTSLIPVTGVSLLFHKLLTTESLANVPWLYFIPVLVPMVLYSLAAIRWAVEQFKREEVLFREAERTEWRLWLRRMLRDKESRPSTGQALFCFALILSLTWFSLGLGETVLMAQAIRYLAFVLTPTLGMALILTTQPRESLAIRWPPWWSWPVSIMLVLLLLPPLAQMTLWILHQFPVIYKLAEESQIIAEWIHSLPAASSSPWRPWIALTVFAWLPALCEEVVFRGFILTGLQRRFRPRTAVIISSFLFALFHLNVFQLLPTFLLGMVLAYLTTRCGSILPSILFHLLYNTLVLLPAVFPDALGGGSLAEVVEGRSMLWLPAVITTPLAAWLLWWLTRLRPHPSYVAFLRSDPSLHKDDLSKPLL